VSIVYRTLIIRGRFCPISQKLHFSPKRNLSLNKYFQTSYHFSKLSYFENGVEILLLLTVSLVFSTKLNGQVSFEKHCISTVGHKSHNPCFHKRNMEAGRDHHFCEPLFENFYFVLCFQELSYLLVARHEFKIFDFI